MVHAKRKVFKLALPLKFERRESDLVIIDRFANDHHQIQLDELNTFEISSIDKDGFALFEVDYSPAKKNRKLTLVIRQVEAGVNGYSLFHSSVARSAAYGHIKSNYEYYKRDRDLSYYALIKKGENKPTKVNLGSLFDSSSRILQFAQIIGQKFSITAWFDKKTLSEHLPSPLRNNRTIKCSLDILTKESFLIRKEEEPNGRKGRTQEVFQKTKKLMEFLLNPRSFHKPNGLNVGQRSLTSD